MQRTQTPAAVAQSRKPKASCCPDASCGPGLKNNYYEGKRLTPDTFRVEQRYLVERRRLLNRAIHGWGVVYGLAIAIDPREGRANMMRRLTIDAGLALDACGRELVQVGCTTLDLGQILVVDERGQRIDDREKAFAASSSNRGEKESERSCWLLEAHYAEQNTDHVQGTDSCRCQHDEWDHVCETVRYSVRRVACRDCYCHVDCELECRCDKHGCGDSHDERETREREINEREIIERERDEREIDNREIHERETELSRRAAMPPKRGGCRCICDHLTHLQPGVDCGCRLCEIDEMCGHARVDLAHGVPLACVEIIRDDCDDWTIGPKIDACGPRRLVKRNDLLFDLIQGCDLTRISEIGWKDWHRQDEQVPFDEFLDALGYCPGEQAEYLTNRFWVTFSRPVRWNTLRPDCFAMTVLSTEAEGGWWQTFRVPIVGVEAIPADDDTPEFVRGATIIVDGPWLYDAVKSVRSMFVRGETSIEIEVRGDFIVDCNGQTVDANAIGRSSTKTGNGSPGGTFLSTFRVATHSVPTRSAPLEGAGRHPGASS
jgi:hypothetical protein